MSQAAPRFRLGARRSQPEQARLILLGTAAVVAGTLAAWLLLWIVTRPPGALSAGWAALDGPGSPVVPFRAEDVRRFGRGLRGERPRGDAEPDLRAALADALRVESSAPLVVYLAAPGADLDGRAFLLPQDESALVTSAGGESGLVALEALLDTLRSDPRRAKLLLLDAGQLATDRDLGLFANGVVHRLEALLREQPVPRLAVLVATSPGQRSWASEADGTTIFAHYVGRGLEGAAAGWDRSGRLTVQGLSRYVRAHVERWARTHRQAVQTPLLLGDATLNAPLRPARRVATPSLAADPKAAAASLAELRAGWEARDRLAALRPERHAGLLWRAYLDRLLRAEALLRAGRDADARGELAGARELAARVETRARGIVPPRAWTLAEAAGAADPARARAGRDAGAALARLDDRLTGRQAIRELLREPAPPPPAPAPAAKAEGEATKAKEAAPALPAPAREVPLAELVAPLREAAGSGRPRFVEAQLALWAAAYLDQPARVPFEGRRADVLATALALRRAAEAVEWEHRDAAPAFGLLLDRAHDRRRDGQDLLFSPEAEATEGAAAALREAQGTLDAAARRVATARRADDLVARLALVLPDYAAWVGRREDRPDPAFQALLAEVEALAGRLANPPEADAAEGWGEVEAAVGRVESGLSRLDGEFLAACEAARAAARPARWRELDDLLLVPHVPAATRLALLERLRSPALTPALATEPDSPPDRGATLDAAAEPDARVLNEAFARARAEAALLALADAPAAPVGKLREAIESAARGASSPAVRQDALARASTDLRAARAELARRLTPARSAGEPARTRALHAAAMAARVLPRAFLARLPEDAAPDLALDRHRESLYLARLASRLVADNDPETALAVLDTARAVPGATDLDLVRDAALALSRARLALQARPAGGVTLRNEEVPLELAAVGDAAIPPGRGAVLLNLDADRPVLAREEPGPLPRPLVPLPPEGGSARSYVLQRTEYGPDPLAFEARPALFYRGKVYPAERPLALALAPAEEEVEVAIRDRDFTGSRDQFRNHPGRGYLHYGATLRYRLLLTNRRDVERTVWVGQALDGQAPRTATLTLKPGETNQEVTGQLRAVDLGPPPAPDAAPAPGGTPPPAAPMPPPKPGNDEVALGTPRVLTVIVREGGPNGRALAASRRYEFHQMDVSQYAAATAQFDPGYGRLRLIARHLPTDRVLGPLKFTAMIAGNRFEFPTAVRGEFAWFDWYFPRPFPEKVQWSVDVGLKANAFSGERATNVAPPAPPPASADPSSGSGS
jgi:hypothetical protein